ncbi:hypothetical protein PAHAL_1G047900 [Panicum hallii]|uniref:Uncharacterized protein n=1 Tax=Panicum hallii TaxID=206008 RepID=A0A2T8KU20_9POAL|nr:hypothetical protein PAHAL_1G047900 [Panicum hallii]
MFRKSEVHNLLSMFINISVLPYWTIQAYSSLKLLVIICTDPGNCSVALALLPVIPMPHGATYIEIQQLPYI